MRMGNGKRKEKKVVNLLQGDARETGGVEETEKKRRGGKEILKQEPLEEREKEMKWRELVPRACSSSV